MRQTSIRIASRRKRSSMRNSGPRARASACADDTAPSPIDRAAIAGLASDVNAQRRLLRIFTDAQRADGVALDAAIATNDGPAAARAAHRMTGAARMIGAEALASICRRMTAAAQAADWKSIAQDRTLLESELGRVSDAVAAFLDALTADDSARDRPA